MFFKHQALKRLFKRAYKDTGLRVGHYLNEEKDEEAYYIAGSHWIIWFNARFFAKEVKAAIIELCGDLPEPNQVFNVRKDIGCQYEINNIDYYNFVEKFKKANIHFRITNTILERSNGENRLLQAENETKRIISIDEDILKVLDINAIDYNNGEIEPTGPVATNVDKPSIMWGNNACYLMVLPRLMDSPEIDEYRRVLETVVIL